MKKQKANQNAFARRGALRVHDDTRQQVKLKKASRLDVHFGRDVQWELQPSHDSRRALLDAHRVIAVTSCDGPRALNHVRRLVVSQRFTGRLDVVSMACWA